MTKNKLKAELRDIAKKEDWVRRAIELLKRTLDMAGRIPLDKIPGTETSIAVHNLIAEGEELTW